MELSASTFWFHWRKQFAFARGHSLLLACSGGRDSMALAHIFLACKIPFQLAHVNYQLRAADSQLDEEQVRAFANKHNIPFHLKIVSPNEIDSSKSIQLSARNLRYQWFYSLLVETKCAFIATAHHANDNAETVLMNLGKGTGIKGLHGIPARNEKVIRPLLPFTREAISTYVLQQEISFREDASNAKTDYLRNAIRHQVLPALETLIPSAIPNISETTKRVAAAECIYNDAIAAHLKKCVEHKQHDAYLPIRKLQKISGYTAVLYEWLAAHNFSPGQIADANALLESHTGRFIENDTHRLSKHNHWLILSPKKTEAAHLVLVPKDQGITPTVDGVLAIKEPTSKAAFSDNNFEVMIDADHLTFPLVLRRWKTGDFIYPLGMGNKRKKVARLYIDAKMPKHEKEKQWILCSGEKIIWVIGLRLDERFAIKSSTKNTLKFLWQPAE